MHRRNSIFSDFMGILALLGGPKIDLFGEKMKTLKPCSKKSSGNIYILISIFWCVFGQYLKKYRFYVPENSLNWSILAKSAKKVPKMPFLAYFRPKLGILERDFSLKRTFLSFSHGPSRENGFTQVTESIILIKRDFWRPEGEILTP